MVCRKSSKVEKNYRMKINTYKTKVVRIPIRGKYLQMFAGYDLSSSITLENINVAFAQDVNHK